MTEEIEGNHRSKEDLMKRLACIIVLSISVVSGGISFSNVHSQSEIDREAGALHKGGATGMGEPRATLSSQAPDADTDKSHSTEAGSLQDKQDASGSSSIADLRADGVFELTGKDQGRIALEGEMRESDRDPEATLISAQGAFQIVSYQLNKATGGFTLTVQLSMNVSTADGHESLGMGEMAITGQAEISPLVLLTGRARFSGLGPFELTIGSLATKGKASIQGEIDVKRFSCTCAVRFTK